MSKAGARELIMKKVQYLAAAKAEVVKQVSERGHTLVDVAKRLKVLDKSLCLWVRLVIGQPPADITLSHKVCFCLDTQMDGHFSVSSTVSATARSDGKAVAWGGPAAFTNAWPNSSLSIMAPATLR